MAEVQEAEILPASAEETEIQALMRAALDNFDEYLDYDTGLKDSAYDVVAAIEEPGLFADTLATQLNIKVSQKQLVLEAFDEELFCELIDRIILQSNTKIRFRLKNGLELPESIERTVR